MNPLLKRNFIFLTLANCLAFCGWVFRNYIINWYVLEKTNSTFMVGLIAAIPTLIVPFVSPFGGQLADKFSRKTVFFISRAASLGFFFFLAFFVQIDFYPLLCIALCFVGIGFTAGFEIAASRNLILDVVGFKYLTWGNSITEFVNAFLSTAGPLFMALFFTSTSNTGIFFSMPIVQTLSVIAAFLLFMSFKETKDEKSEEIDDGLKKDKSILDGVLYAFRSTNIRILLILSSTLLFWGLSQPLIPKIARDALNSGSTGYAILLSSDAVGCMIGAIALPLFPRIFRNSKAIVFCITAYSLLFIIFALSKSILLSVILLALGGFFHLIWFTVIIILIQTISDTDHKGRVVGLFFTVIQAYGLGFLLGGLLGELIGITSTIIIASLLSIAIHLVAFGSSREFRLLKS